MHEVLEGEDEAKCAGGEEDGADEVGHFFRGAFSNDIEGAYDRQLKEGQDRVRQPEDAKPVVLMVGGGDADLADRRDSGDQISLVPAKKELGQGEGEEATAGAQHEAIY